MLQYFAIIGSLGGREGALRCKQLETVESVLRTTSLMVELRNSKAVSLSWDSLRGDPRFEKIIEFLSRRMHRGSHQSHGRGEDFSVWRASVYPRTMGRGRVRTERGIAGRYHGQRERREAAPSAFLALSLSSEITSVQGFKCEISAASRGSFVDARGRY